VENESKVWEYQGKKFMRCPKCNEAMLADKLEHKCGWGKLVLPISQNMPQSSEDVNQQATLMVSECIKEAENILGNRRAADDQFIDFNWILNVADQLRRTRIALAIRK